MYSEAFNNAYHVELLFCPIQQLKGELVLQEDPGVLTIYEMLHVHLTVF